MESKKPNLESIIPIWQPIGYSTHLISQRIAEKNNVKTSHTGTLDPMAEGVIIVLKGEERLKKKEYAEWLKGYSFTIVFGVSTDSLDGLGLIEGTNFLEIKSSELDKTARELIGKYKQTIPKFSTKKVRGKHLHQYARRGEDIALPQKEGEIINLKLKSFRQEKTHKIIGEQLEKINRVRGDFRQKRIRQGWEEFLKDENIPKYLLFAEFEVITTKGIYIRSLARDICQSLNTLGFAGSIVRKKNGNYHKKDCKNLNELFTKDELEGNYLN